MSPPSSTVEEWEDKHVKLTIEQPPDGFWCSIKLLARVPLAPDTIFDILTDPHNHRVFRGVKCMRHRKILKDDGHGKQEVEVEQVGCWRFGPFKGQFTVKLCVEQDKRRGTVGFRLHPKQRGFMKNFTGEWSVQPYDADAIQEMVVHPGKHWGPLHDAARALHRWEERVTGRRPTASLVQLRQSVQPAAVPPPPLDRILQKISAAQVLGVMEDLMKEAARLNALEERESRRERERERQQQKTGGKEHILAHVWPLGRWGPLPSSA